MTLLWFRSLWHGVIFEVEEIEAWIFTHSAQVLEYSKGFIKC
jgi:hypothetical protein